jgi:hypothetical protein
MSDQAQQLRQLAMDCGRPCGTGSASGTGVVAGAETACHRLGRACRRVSDIVAALAIKPRPVVALERATTRRDFMFEAFSVRI